MTTNAERTDWANVALQAFATEANQNPTVYGAETLGDLLADLRHWANANGIDYDNADDIGAHHYKEDVQFEAESKDTVRGIYIT